MKFSGDAGSQVNMMGELSLVGHNLYSIIFGGAEEYSRILYYKFNDMYSLLWESLLKKMV